MEKLNPNEKFSPLDPADEIWFEIKEDIREREELLAGEPNSDQEQAS